MSGRDVMRDATLVRGRLAFLQAAMTRLPAGALVVYEDAGFHDDRMREIVGAELGGRVDVHSLNEDELQSYLGRRVDLLDVADVAKALAEFRRFASAPTVVVHTKYWALAHGERAGDRFSRADLATVRQLGVHPGGSPFAAALGRRLGPAICCVPGRLLDVELPTTIGLGDTFVAGFLAAHVRAAGWPVPSKG